MNIDKQKIVLFLQKEIPSLQAIYLFGSVASGENTKDSDVDLAFLSSRLLSSVARYNLSQVLAQKLNKRC